MLLGDRQLMPVKFKTITYLGSDQKLFDQLSRYIEVIPYRQPDVPAIIDNRATSLQASANDIVLANMNQAIIRMS